MGAGRCIPKNRADRWVGELKKSECLGGGKLRGWQVIKNKRGSLNSTARFNKLLERRVKGKARGGRRRACARVIASGGTGGE